MSPFRAVRGLTQHGGAAAKRTVLLQAVRSYSQPAKIATWRRARRLPSASPLKSNDARDLIRTLLKAQPDGSWVNYSTLTGEERTNVDQGEHVV